MKHRTRCFVLSLLAAMFLILFACSKDSTSPKPESTFSIPLATGNRWEYRREERYYDCRNDSTPAAFFLDSLVLTIEHKITGSKVFDDSITTYVMAERLGFVSFPEYLCTFETDVFYANAKDGLYEHAHRNRARCNSSGQSQPKIYLAPAILNILLPPFDAPGLHPRIADGDTVIQRIQPRKHFPYPPVIGQEWLFVETPTRILKKIAGTEKIQAQAGEFDCYKVQSFFDVDGDGAWDDGVEFSEYWGKQGLVRQHVLLKDVGISSGVNPPAEPEMYCTYEENIELISFSLE